MLEFESSIPVEVYQILPSFVLAGQPGLKRIPASPVAALRNF
jgi:hypothetical protein